MHYIASVGCVVEVGRREVRQRRHIKTVVLYRPNPHLYQITRGVYIGHPTAILAEMLKLTKGVL